MRARDVGIKIGYAQAGPNDSITDVAGVRVGHATLIEGEGPLVVGEGPVRTGVTVIIPHGRVGHALLFAGAHRLNGNGELTGLEWVRESGLLTSPIGITNTHSVGVVRDALIGVQARSAPPGDLWWSLPVVGETWDGTLNDVNGQHVRPEHVEVALASATDGPVAEGNVGGGTGMICHGFKGGIGSASRVVPAAAGGFTVGVLVQANYGRRERLAVNGVPVGTAIPPSEVPLPSERTAPWGEWPDGGQPAREGAGSIIVIVATDAPLLPHQCERLAQRAGLGVARMGGAGENSSGDLFIAFSTANAEAGGASAESEVRMLSNDFITPLFYAAIEATEEAILNGLLAADTMTGRDGNTAYRLPSARLLEVMAAYGRAPD